MRFMSADVKLPKSARSPARAAAPLWQSGDMTPSTGSPMQSGWRRWLGSFYLALGVLWIVLALTAPGSRIPELIAGFLSLLTGCIWLFSRWRRAR